MATSRTLNRPTFKTKPIRHWTNVPAQPPEVQVEEGEQAPSVHAKVVQVHKFFLCVAAVLISPIVFILSILTINYTAGLGLLVNFATWAFAKYAANCSDYCSECRGKVSRKASNCPHCHVRF